MIRNIIKYVGIALVLAGIFLVMKNLFSKDTDWGNDKKINTKSTYSVTIKLLDKDTKNYLEGSKLVLKNEKNELVAEWITTDKAHTINNLDKGKYTLTQVEAITNYHLNKESITFELNNSKEVVIYNTKMTEEEIKEANTTNTEVGVDNTASSKSILIYLTTMLTTIIGLGLIFKTRKEYQF